jgi:hypothetical protein
MTESEAKWTVYCLLLVGTVVSALLVPPDIRVFAVFGYIGLFALVAYFKNGVVFGQRVYPWGIEYNKRSKKKTGLFKKSPKKNGKDNHKRK